MTFTASITPQAAFAANYTAFLDGIANASPLTGEFCNSQVFYIGNDLTPLKQPVPSLIRMPGLTPREDLIRRLKQEHRLFHSSDTMLDGFEAFKEEIQHSVFDLCGEVGLVQGVVDKADSKARALSYDEVELIRSVQSYRDKFLDPASENTELFPPLFEDIYIAEHFLMSATLLTCAGTPECAMNAADFLGRAASIYIDARCYSAAAMVSDMAARVYESVVHQNPKTHLLLLNKAAQQRKAAADLWHRSLSSVRPLHTSDLDEIEIYLGITNGLFYEAAFENKIVDQFLARAAIWHLSNAMNEDAANDLMYLIYRQMHRPSDFITEKRWREIASTIRDATSVWQKSGRAQNIFADAMMLAGAAQALGGDLCDDLIEFMKALCMGL
ncbi:MAG: hypothetical protein ABH871_05865 [Pseudomonadota bacterium]